MPTGSGAFAIAGDVGGLVPGRWATIRLTLANQTASDLLVTGITVTVAPDSTPPGCRSAENLELTQSTVSWTSPVSLPAGGSVVVDAAPQAPQILLIDIPGVNQDACRGVSFSLDYAGTAIR